MVGGKVVHHEKSKKHLFFQWCEVTTCAGVIDCFLARSLVGRIFWLFLIFTGLSLTIWHTTTQITDFIYGNRFQTSLSVVTNGSVPFPKVTVCNFNRIDKKLATNLSATGLKFALPGNPHDLLVKLKPNSSSFKEDYLQMMKENNITDLDHLYRLYGHTCENTFSTCAWNLMTIDCCSHVKEIVNENGRCWTIDPFFKGRNNSRHLHQTFAGTYYGLQLVLNPNTDTHMQDHVVTEGMLLVPHYYDALAISHFLVLPIGTRSWITLTPSVKRYEVSNLPLFVMPCRENTTLTYYDLEYSKANCDADCWANATFHMYQCVPIGPGRKNYTPCSPVEVEQLYARNNIHKFSEDIERAFKTCQQRCNYPCTDYWQVTSTVTSTTNAGPSSCESFCTGNGTSINGTNNNILRSLISATIFFSSLEYTAIVTTERNPLFNFISDIGGQLSLWLGISIVTIIQTVYYLVSMFFTSGRSVV